VVLLDEKVPAGQFWQLVMPGAGEILPGSHVWHGEAPVEKVPATQREQIDAPGSVLVLPGGQAWHVIEAVDVENNVGGQSLHVVAPNTTWTCWPPKVSAGSLEAYLPTPQLEHEADWAWAYRPALHGIQLEFDTEPEEGFDVPAGQLSHLQLTLHSMGGREEKKETLFLVNVEALSQTPYVPSGQPEEHCMLDKDLPLTSSGLLDNIDTSTKAKFPALKYTPPASVWNNDSCQ
jgi:hypothetical protein